MRTDGRVDLDIRATLGTKTAIRLRRILRSARRSNARTRPSANNWSIVRLWHATGAKRDGRDGARYPIPLGCTAGLRGAADGLSRPLAAKRGGTRPPGRGPAAAWSNCWEQVAR